MINIRTLFLSMALVASASVSAGGYFEAGRGYSAERDVTFQQYRLGALERIGKHGDITFDAHGAVRIITKAGGETSTIADARLRANYGGFYAEAGESAVIDESTREWCDSAGMRCTYEGVAIGWAPAKPIKLGPIAITPHVEAHHISRVEKRENDSSNMFTASIMYRF